MRKVQPIIPTAVRQLDIAKPLSPITDVREHNSVLVVVKLHEHLLGNFIVVNYGHAISVTRLRDAIVANLSLKLLDVQGHLSPDVLWAKIISDLTRNFVTQPDQASPLPSHISVSVVLATRDRPDALRECLSCLAAQKTIRPVEVIVVDNNAASGVTPPVVAEFPNIVLVSEKRKGLSYARNRGFVASTGDIVIAIDDDVTIPPDWLERLVAPFARNDVMAVTGNVLPYELDTKAQLLFEEYGGLGRGFSRLEVDRDWFDGFKYGSVPTWMLGATANAAFRATIFSHPRIGMLDEALGAGTATGCSEDTYLFYKILRAGYTLVYEPEAYVWHKHRRDMSALRHQIYNYSKGHVAYHLTTLINNRDFRALIRLFLGLPRAHLWRILERVRGRSVYPVSLILLEGLGNLLGPFALWRSRLRVKRLGRSTPYLPASKPAVTQRTKMKDFEDVVCMEG